jgi:hypothetical protein
MIEIFISNQRVYAGSEIDLGINKKIYDLFEPDKRASDQTLTVDLVGNKENDQLFRGLFDVNVFVGTNSPTFDPSKRASAIIYADTIEQLRGFVQLTDVVVNYQNQVIYKIVFYGQNSDLFKKLSDKRLNELDLSEYDHVWNYDNISNSWATSVIQNGGPVSFELGKGYFYPMVYTNRDGQKETPDNWYVRYFTPWIYFKTLIDAIFSEAGFSYQSNFFNSEKFKRLIFSGDVVNERTAAEIEATLVEVGRTNTFDVTANFTDIPFNDTITDPLTQWNVDRFEPDLSAYYRFTGGIPLKVIKTSGPDLVFAELNVDVLMELVIFDTVTNTDVKIYPFSQRVKTTQSPFQVGDFLDFYLDFTIDTEGDAVKLDSTKDIAFVRVRSAKYAGQSTATTRSIFSDSKVEIQSTAYFSAIISPTLESGDTLNVTKYLGELTQKDWLMGVAKMFNLYFEPLEDGTILVEPRDQGYFTNDLIDITKELDISKDFIIKPLEQSKYRQYKYTYTSGKDRLNASYEQGWGEVYGALTFQPENEFAKDNKEVKIPFSLPIQARSPITPSIVSKRVVPAFLNTQNDERYKPATVPRVLLVDGLRGTLSQWTFESVVWNFYPHAGQMDSLDTPTIDLAFGEPNAIYWLREGRNDVAYPENISLFWQYHYQELQQITGKNSKVVECYIKIDPILYREMTFRKLYFIDNAYYRLYEIENYNPLQVETTKCIFLKLEDVAALPITPRPIYGGGGVSDIGDTNTDDRSVDRVIKTDNNVQSGTGVIAIGTENVIQNGVNSVIVGGNENQVGANDVLLWGLDNQSINNAGVHLGFNFVEIDSDFTMPPDAGSPFYIFMDNGGGNTITLPSPSISKGKYVYVNKTGSGTMSVDLEATTDTVQNNHTHSYFSTGTAWKIINKSSI